MHFTDRLTLDGEIRRTGDGYAVVSARVARAGNVQAYTGAEIGVSDKAVVRVYRPADAVFRRDALASYAGVPVTVGHPAGKVDATSWKDLAVGEVGDEVLRDGDFVRVPMMLRDAKAIAAVEGGMRELSMGYDAQLTMADGLTPDGQPFDAVMSDFKMNHVAIVDKARGGHELRIGDGAVTWGASPISTTDERNPVMPEANLRTVVVDGLSVQTTDQGAQAIDKLQKAVADALAKAADAETAHAAAIKAKDEEIGSLKAENQKIKDAAPKPADLDRMVAARVALVTTARAIVADVKVDGLTDADIRKSVVTSKLGAELVKDASDDMIAGMFKAIAKDAKPVDPFRAALQSRTHTADSSDPKAVADAAYAKRTETLRGAWEPKTAA